MDMMDRGFKEESIGEVGRGGGGASGGDMFFAFATAPPFL